VVHLELPAAGAVRHPAGSVAPANELLRCLVLGRAEQSTISRVCRRATRTLGPRVGLRMELAARRPMIREPWPAAAWLAAELDDRHVKPKRAETNAGVGGSPRLVGWCLPRGRASRNLMAACRRRSSKWP
jgi:hypothetical protein